MQRNRLPRSCLTLLLLLGWPPPALAVDGVAEINQASALAGGVTGTDAAGFPVTLDAPGSYRLTGDLVVDENTTAIEITSDRVTLDLNGFGIRGPTTCSLTTPFPPVVSCSTTGTGDGIRGGAVSGTVIRNGRIGGIGRHAIDLGDPLASGAVVSDMLLGRSGGDCLRGPIATEVTDVFIGSCGGDGLDLAASSRVRHARVQAVGGWAMTAASPFEVADALITSATSGGIQTTGAGGATVEDSSIANVGGDGIDVGPGSVITNVTSNLNVGAGILCDAGCRVTDVRTIANGGSGLATGAVARITGVQSNGNTGDGVSAGDDSLVLDSRIDANGGSGELVLGSGSAYGNNLIEGGTTVSGSGLVEISTNVCNGNVTCP